MKAIKIIMITFAIIGVLMEGFFLAAKFGAYKETEKINTDHASYACQVTQAEDGYIYSYEGETYSEADYLDLLNKAADATDVLLVAQGVLVCLFIIGAVAAGRSAKKRNDNIQPALAN